MMRFFKFLIYSLVFLLGACQNNTGSSDTASHSADIHADSLAVSSEFSITGSHAENGNILLRAAFLGDAEPKPLAEFPNMHAAVRQINALAEKEPLDLVIGVGDIAHKGTIIQYEAATKVLRNLEAPFYPIMGNEERGSTVERYLHYAQKWNSDIKSPNYVISHNKLAFVFASPDHGRDFDDSGAGWILEQVRRLAPRPVILVVHGAQKGAYPENPDKGVSNRLFIEKVISQPNLAVIISGDLHMDMDRVTHSKQLNHVHYLHIPALERTKIPDETNHTPMFRVMTIAVDGHVTVDTYAVGNTVPLEKHAYSFPLLLDDR